MNKLILPLTILCCLVGACRKQQAAPTEPPVADSNNEPAATVVIAKVATRPAEIAPATPDMDLDLDPNMDGIVPTNRPGQAISRPGRAIRKPGGGNGPPHTPVFHFIRLEHDGKAWNDGMTAETGRADQNFLDYFRGTTGFKIRTPESIPIAALKLYKRGQAPPLVFLTGQSLAGITHADWKTLRQYCIDGGLIFADNGGGTFDHDFRILMRNIFPDQPLTDIPNDDPIFLDPYRFPAGAPPLWHRSEKKRALGVRAPDTYRLCVFYHPDNLNSAWKTGNGLGNEKITTAFKLGINVVNYAYINYLNMHYPEGLLPPPPEATPPENTPAEPDMGIDANLENINE